MAELLLLALMLALGGWALLWLSRRKMARSGVPEGQLVYTDTSAWRRCERPLFSERYRLAGKPDYLVREASGLVPVEVKPRRQASQPYESDVLQLGAYCLLTEEAYGGRPGHALLQYANGVFSIPYTDALRNRLLLTLENMRSQLGAKAPLPNHHDPRRCRACGFRTYCDQSIGNAE